MSMLIGRWQNRVWLRFASRYYRLTFNGIYTKWERVA